eukprot:CAMPEP_0115046716 /NCGR_PEP_ID=MMETSP0216-20121206/48902_1 /TAXON_ID=223996 /ORGANISM="Protocruzia adherens, Strain Boccale" /LENGTH=646 /DNA_ID=CAMNT_0002429825 /DNA_START=633 /DNA_END=2573 /DNA_ORIENTATION=+
MPKNDKDQNRSQRQYSTLSSSLSNDHNMQQGNDQNDDQNNNVNSTLTAGDIDLQSEQFALGDQEMYFDDPKYWGEDGTMFAEDFGGLDLQDKEKKAFNTTSYKEEWSHLPHAVEDDDRYERVTSTLSNRGASSTATSNYPRWDQNSNYDAQIRNNMSINENRELPNTTQPLLSQFSGAMQIQNPNVKKTISKPQASNPTLAAISRQETPRNRARVMNMNPAAGMGVVGMNPIGVPQITPGRVGVGVGVGIGPVGTAIPTNGVAFPGLQGGPTLAGDPRLVGNGLDDGLKEKREKQMIRNRISAQKSRDKKKQYVTQLEDNIKRRDDEVFKLRGKIESLERSNRELDEMIRRYAQTSQHSIFGLPMNGPSIFDESNAMNNATTSLQNNLLAGVNLSEANVAAAAAAANSNTTINPHVTNANLQTSNGQTATSSIASSMGINTANPNGNQAGAGNTTNGGGQNGAMLHNLGFNQSQAATFGVLAVLTAMAMNTMGGVQRTVPGQFVQPQGSVGNNSGNNAQEPRGLFSQGVLAQRQPSEGRASHGRQSSGDNSMVGNLASGGISTLLGNQDQVTMDGLAEPISTIADLAPSEDCMSTTSSRFTQAAGGALGMAGKEERGSNQNDQGTDIRNFGNGQLNQHNGNNPNPF